MQNVVKGVKEVVAGLEEGSGSKNILVIDFNRGNFVYGTSSNYYFDYVPRKINYSVNFSCQICLGYCL